MISSFQDYKAYVKADQKAHKKENLSFKKKIKEYFFADYIWEFQKSLRRYEYLKNTHRGSFHKKILLLFAYKRYKKISIKLGFSIPPNVFGPGLRIAHYGTIVVNNNARIGANCRIHICVNIGTSGGSLKAPVLGDNVYIAPGAKIFGDIVIANNTVIGANAVVNRSFTEPNCVIAGNPAKVIKKLVGADIKKFIPHVEMQALS